MTKSSKNRVNRKKTDKLRLRLAKEAGDRVDARMKEAREKADAELAKANEDLKGKIRDGMMDDLTGVKVPDAIKLPLKERLDFKWYMVKQFFKRAWFVTKCNLGFGNKVPTQVCTGFNPDTGGIALLVHMEDTTIVTVGLSRDAACTIGQELIQYTNMGIAEA